MLTEEEFSRTSPCITYKPNNYAKSEPRTAVCFGMARGGTSAVAGVLEAMGVFMGENLENNYEDLNFIGQDATYMNQVIAERNEKHHLWGWKTPHASSFLPFVYDSLRNPLFVVVFRDPIAIAKAHARYYLKETQHVLDEYVMSFMDNTLVTRRLGAPALFVSYEKLIAFPAEGVRQIADFLGIEPLSPDHEARLVEFLTPSSESRVDGYKKVGG